MAVEKPESVKRAERAFLDGDRQQAIELAKKAVRQYEDAGDRSKLIQALSQLEFLLMGDPLERTEHYSIRARLANLKQEEARERVDEIEQSKGRGHQDLIDPLLELARVHTRRLYEGRHEMPENTNDLDKEYQSALALHDRAEAICRKSYGENSREYASCLQARANFLSFQAGSPERSIALNKKALETLQSIDGSSDDVIRAMASLALAYSEAGMHAESAAFYERVLSENPNHRAADSLRRLLAIQYRRMGKTKRSLELTQQLNDEDETRLQEKPFLMVPRIWGHADDLFSQGNARDAERVYRKALGYQAHHPDGPGFISGLIKKDLAECLIELGRLDEAESVALEAVKEVSESLGNDHLHVSSCLLTAAGCLQESGSVEAAKEFIVQGAGILINQPKGMLYRFRNVAKEYLRVLGEVNMPVLADRIRNRMESLPKKWHPPG